MDPVKDPMCVVCGATDDLVGRPGHGWVCAVSGPCIERSTKRAWLPVARSGGTLETKLLVVEPYYREDYSPEEKAHFAALAAQGTKPYHPLDQQFPLDNRGPQVCDVCGTTEGSMISVGVTWLCADMKDCVARSRDVYRRELRATLTMLEQDPLEPIEPTCRRCGSPDLLVSSSPYGRTCEPCLEGDTLPDYEALGYPETACGNARLDEVAWLVGFMQRAQEALVEKDIRDATDNG